MNVVEIVFSPTGGTKKVADIIGKTWSEHTVRSDLSDPKTDFTKCEMYEGSIPTSKTPKISFSCGLDKNRLSSVEEQPIFTYYLFTIHSYFIIFRR